MDCKKELKLASDDIELNESLTEDHDNSDHNNSFLIKDHTREDRMIKSEKARDVRHNITERLEVETNRGYRGKI